MHGDHPAAHGEVEELLLENARVHDQAVAVVASGSGRWRFEDRDIGQGVRARVSGFGKIEGPLPALRTLALDGVIDDGRFPSSETPARQFAVASTRCDGQIVGFQRGPRSGDTAPPCPALSPDAHRRHAASDPGSDFEDSVSSPCRGVQQTTTQLSHEHRQDTTQPAQGPRRAREDRPGRDTGQAQGPDRPQDRVEEQRPPGSYEPDLVAGQKLPESPPLQSLEPLRNQLRVQRGDGRRRDQEQHGPEPEARGGGWKASSDHQARTEHRQRPHQHRRRDAEPLEEQGGDRRSHHSGSILDQGPFKNRVHRRMSGQGDPRQQSRPQ